MGKEFQMARILVADDLAREDRNTPAATLKVAGSLAEALNSEIHLVHTYEIPELSELTLPKEKLLPLEATYVDAAKKALDEESESLRGRRPRLRLVPEVEKGRTVDVLLEEVRGHEIELAVLGTHARSGVKRTVLGSVAEEFVRCSPVPVLTVNPATEVTEEYRPANILVALEMNPNELPLREALVDASVRFAKAFGASISLAHVVEEWVYPFVQSASLLAGGVFLPLERNLEERGNERYSELSQIARDLRSSGLSVDIRLIERAPGVAEAILRTAQATGADLIVMGHRSAGRVQYALAGSVNRQIIREAHCPVLSLPNPSV